VLKKTITIVLIFISHYGFAQQSVVSSGSSVVSDQGSFSFSVGQILTSQNLSSSSAMFGESIILSHGVQQVFLQTCGENEKVEILATPNPSDGKFTINLINWDEKEINLNIYDALGKNVFAGNIKNDQTKLNLSFLSSGVYIMSLGYHCGTLSTFKLLINKK
tara:strand:+ start:115 stop:600 length:486 start_codon:yes stop_codon:yes gene_type:complete